MRGTIKRRCRRGELTGRRWPSPRSSCSAFGRLRRARVARRRASRPSGRSPIRDRRLVARRRRGSRPARRGVRLRAAVRARPRRHPPRLVGPRRRLRRLQGGERPLLRADGGPGLPARQEAGLGVVGGARRRALGRDSLVDLGGDRDDGEPCLLHGGVGAVRDHARAREADRRPPARAARRGRRRIRDASPARRAVRDLARRARARLVDPPGESTASESRSRAALAERRADRCSPSRVLAGRVLSGSSPRESFGAYWELWRGYDPLAGGEVARLPPRRLRDLPRGDTAGRRADRALEPAPQRSGRLRARRRLRRALPLGQRRRAPRRRRVQQHAVRVRPPPRPLRLLPHPALAHRAGRVARGRAPEAARRDRERRRPGSRPPRDSPVPAARERGRHRHRSRRALGLAREPDGWTGPALGPPAARRVRRRAPRRSGARTAAASASPSPLPCSSSSSRWRASPGSA